MRDFRFTNEHKSSELGAIAAVLERPRLWIPTEADYPAHGEWVQKAEAQIGTGIKRAMMAYRGLEPVGVCVYQQHETRSNTVEIRNLSVTPDVQGRYVGSFLLRNVEAEASLDFPGSTLITGDTKATNYEMISFLLKHGYLPEEITDLYGQDTGLDAVLTKQLAA